MFTCYFKSPRSPPECINMLQLKTLQKQTKSCIIGQHSLHLQQYEKLEIQTSVFI